MNEFFCVLVELWHQTLLVTESELVDLDVFLGIPEILPCSEMILGIKALLLNDGFVAETPPQPAPSSPMCQTNLHFSPFTSFRLHDTMLHTPTRILTH